MWSRSVASTPLCDRSNPLHRRPVSLLPTGKQERTGRRTLCAMTDLAPGDGTGHTQGRPDGSLLQLVEIWHRACTDFVDLVRDIPREQWELPTDLPTWTVKDNVAHTAHLEAVLAGAPEETLEVAEAPHLRALQNYYTEQGVLARRDHDMESLADELEQAVAARYAELREAPPTDGSAAPPRTPGGAPWDTRTLLSNRPFDVWMHDQDVRRADRPAGRLRLPRRPARAGQARPGAADGRGQAARPSRRDTSSGSPCPRPTCPGRWPSLTTVGPRDRRRGRLTTRPTTSVTLSPEDFVVLAGGRRTPERTRPLIEGDEDLGRRLVQSLAVTP